MTLQVRRTPFPHVVADGWWDEALLRDVLGEFPEVNDPGWRRYANSQERKSEGGPHLWGPRTKEFFELAAERGPELAEAFGTPELHMETIGGGYHLIEPGGYLDVHADFNQSPATGRYRRLNLLVYLNDDWQDEGGHLELWNAREAVQVIAPDFGTTVVFETSDHSWHGHPRPARRYRRSVAAYFFTEEPPPGFRGEHSTLWHGRQS